MDFVTKGAIDIGSGKGWSLNMWQTITCTNDDPVLWCIDVSPGLSGLNHMTVKGSDTTIM